MIKTIDQKVEFATLVRAEPERVYDAMATAEGLDGWFTKGSSVDARPGGKINFRWENWGYQHYSGEDGGPVLEAKRPERFSFQWKVDCDPYNTTVEIIFKPFEDGTLVKVVEHGFEDTPSGLKNMLERAAGWGEALTLMKFHVERS
jgi:uncharacterized protein YndB with AHSA1/START domain